MRKMMEFVWKMVTGRVRGRGGDRLKPGLQAGARSFEELVHAGRGMGLSKEGVEARDGELWHLARDRRFAALLGLIAELQEDLDGTCADYEATPEWKGMAGGGSAALRELLWRLKGIMEEKREAADDADERR